MSKYGKAVQYESQDGKTELAFVVKEYDGGAEADLVLASGGKQSKVARRAEGGGHTYRDGKV